MPDETAFAAVMAPLMRQGLAFLQQKDAEAAARCYEAVLRLRHGYAPALRQLAAVRMQQHRLDDALALLRKSLDKEPNAAAFHNLGLVLQWLNRPEEAIPAFEQAIALRPGFAASLNSLGISLAAVGRHEEAARRFQATLDIDPTHAGALNNLGSILHRAGRLREALDRFQAALAQDRGFFEASLNTAMALASLGRTKEAIPQYRATLAIDPNHAVTHLHLADELFKIHHHDDALRHYDRALALQPSLAYANAGRGRVLQELGDIAEAGACFRRAIAADPRRPTFYLSLARNTALMPDDPDLKRMMPLAADMASLSANDQVILRFALGKALADAGEPDRAFEHLLAGNALRRSQLTYNETAELGNLDRIRQVFSPGFMRSREGHGVTSPLPIFILGMPRSGSTLIEQILASHPAVAAAGETHDFPRALRSLGLYTDAAPFPDSVPAWTDEQLQRMGNRYLDRLTALAAARRLPGFSAPSGQAETGTGVPPRSRLTDKSPSNFLHVGLIHLVMPEARIIHSCRDPIDTCLSCFASILENLKFAWDLGELGRYHRGYQRLMRHWHEVLPPGRMLDVRYEDLVTNTEHEIRRILDYCGLDWHDACLRFYETKRPVRTASVVQVRKPIYHTSVGRWRPEPDVLRPLLEGLDAADKTAGECRYIVR